LTENFTENFTIAWDSLNHCEQMSFIHQIGKLIVNTFDMNATTTLEIKTSLWGLFMQMIDEGCWV
jgi:hypothetical protein